jgi:hypothetical protein
MRVIFIGLVALFALVLLGFVALTMIGLVGGPGLLKARQDANEASTIAALRTILSAQITYAVDCGQGSFAPNLDALTRPRPGESMGYLPGDMGGGQSLVRSGYTITMSGVEDPGAVASCNGVSAGKGLRTFSVTASPQGDQGARHFGTTDEGTIYEAPMPIAMPATGAPSGATVVR